MRLYQRILLAPGLALFFLLLFGTVVYRVARADQVAMQEVFNTRFRFFEKSHQVSADIDSAHANVYRLVTWMGSYDATKVTRTSTELTAQIDGAATIVRDLASDKRLTDDEKKTLDATLRQLTDYRKFVSMAIDLAKDDVNMGLSALQTADLSYQELRRSLDTLIGVEKKLAQERYDEVLTTYRSASLLAAMVFLVAIVGAVLTSAFVTRSVTRQLGGEPEYAVEAARRVADGDLSVSIATKAQDDSSLLFAMRAMVGNLRGIVDKIREASVQVASSAGEISASTKLIIQGAQGQALAAEETSTSMGEIAASIQTVAGNAESLANYVADTSSSISEMGASIEQVARSSGTLAGTVTEASATITRMVVSIDQMAKNLERLAATVTDTTATMEEMTSFIASVARNAQALSTAARQTSHTVSEMAGAVTDVAKMTIEADRISAQASEDARMGGEAVARTIEGMKSISGNMENTARVITGLGGRSQEIGRILEVIEEIADQTNLLALNAAIEAARAGEAGRGFAVVADEVRKLAERSVEAVKEIGDVVRQVQQETRDAVEAAKTGATETKQGILLADKAGLALRGIIDSVSRSNQLMAEIASATSKQSRASAEVLLTVTDMTTATTQVTNAVREQAERSKQIRLAMENIKKVMTEAADSTKEQAAGGRQVRLAVESMNKIASHVGIATHEQAAGSRQIIAAVEKMNGMTQQVSHATTEQRRGGELVVSAMENISEIGRDNLTTVEEMSKATVNLAQQAENLAKLVSVFRVR